MKKRLLGPHLDVPTRIGIRAQRKLRGECTQCGLPVESDLKNRATGTKRSMCRKCLRENADKLAGYRKSRFLKGLCERCGKRPSKPKVKMCVECTDKLNKQHRERNKKRFFLARSGGGVLRGTLKVAKIIAFLWKEQRGLCALTGDKLTRQNAEVDHIIPVAKGGNNERDNLRWTTHDANQAKRALSDEDFLLLCKKVVIHAEQKVSE